MIIEEISGAAYYVPETSTLPVKCFAGAFNPRRPPRLAGPLAMTYEAVAYVMWDFSTTEERFRQSRIWLRQTK
jgi:hypothetical protein